MEHVEQVFFNVPLRKMKPIFQQWIREVLIEENSTLNLNQEQSEKLLSIREAADFLNLTVPTIYSKVSRGELPVMKQGKRLYFSNIELIDYLKQGRKKSNADIDAEAEAYLLKKKGRSNRR